MKLLNSVISEQIENCFFLFHQDFQQDKGFDKCTKLILLNGFTKVIIW